MTCTPDESEALLAVADFMQDGADSLPATSLVGRALAAGATDLILAVQREQRRETTRARAGLRLVIAEDLESIQTASPQRIAQLRLSHHQPEASQPRSDTSTWEIGLAYFPRLRLSRAGFKTLADLEGVTDDELLAIDGIGVKSMETIRAALVQLDQEGGE